MEASAHLTGHSEGVPGWESRFWPSDSHIVTHKMWVAWKRAVTIGSALSFLEVIPGGGFQQCSQPLGNEVCHLEGPSG